MYNLESKIFAEPLLYTEVWISYNSFIFQDLVNLRACLVIISKNRATNEISRGLLRNTVKIFI